MIGTRLKLAQAFREMDASKLLFFKFIGLVVIASIAIIASDTLSKYAVLRNNVIDKAHEDAIRLAANFSITIVPKLIITGENGQQTVSIENHPELDFDAFDARVRAVLGAADSVKIKVFSRDAFIIYSTDHGIIGKDDSGNTALKKSLTGEVTSVLVKKDEFMDMAYEKRLGIDLVETYVPIYGQGGQIIGAFEMYSDVTRYLAEAQSTMMRLLGITAAVLVIVFTALSLLMWRATRVIGLKTAQLKATQADLQNTARRAESASQSKSDFLANMSHEIRTPMTAILGFTDMIKEPDISAEDRANYINTIQNNGKHLLSIINDILDLSKIEVDKLEISPTLCNLPQLVGEVIKLMRVRSDDKHIKLESTLDPDLRQHLITDPLRLRQILVNLLGNAIKFTDKGGVTLHVYGDKLAPNGVRFDITDSGIGMTPEQVRALFQPFTQVDESATRKFGGTGLGLAISKRLSKMLGGDISVTSQANKGSTFSLVIDAGEAQEIKKQVRQLENKRKPDTDNNNNDNNNNNNDNDTDNNDNDNDSNSNSNTPDHSPTRSARILVAEDTPDNQRLISFVLKKSGHDATIVENGRLAVDAALAAASDGTPFDLIFMDMQMPVLDGYAATRELRARGYDRPIVALTANAMASDREKCEDAGCDDFTTKPIDRDHFLATLQRHAFGEKTRAA